MLYKKEKNDEVVGKTSEELSAKIEKLLDQNIALGEQNQALRAQLDQPRVDTPLICSECVVLKGMLTWVRLYMFNRTWANDQEHYGQQIDVAAEIDEMLKWKGIE